MELKHCRGCRDNFYNGNNELGVTRCWSFDKKKATVWRIPIGNWENPPYLNKKKVRVPPCWHGEGSNRTHYIKPEALDSQGFWKH